MKSFNDQIVKPVQNTWKSFAIFNFILSIIIVIIAVVGIVEVLNINNMCTPFANNNYMYIGCIAQDLALIFCILNVIYILIYGPILYKKIRTSNFTGLTKLSKFTLVLFGIPLYVSLIIIIILGSSLLINLLFFKVIL